RRLVRRPDLRMGAGALRRRPRQQPVRRGLCHLGPERRLSPAEWPGFLRRRPQPVGQDLHRHHRGSRRRQRTGQRAVPARRRPQPVPRPGVAAVTAALPVRPAPAGWRQRLLRLMPWHRRLALLACLGIFGWALSRLLHPLMSALQPRPAVMLPPQPVLPLEGLKAPGPLLASAGVVDVQGLRLLLVDGEPYYQARLAGRLEPRYWHVRSGV